MNLCGFEVGLNARFFLIAGPCVIESEALALATAADLKKLTGELGIPFIYKSSFDKANRTSLESFRGPGLEEGLRILAEVRAEVGVPVLTDFHAAADAAELEAARALEIAASAALAPRNVHVNINFYAAPIFRLLGADPARDHVDVVADQAGCPTWTRDLCPALVEVVNAPVLWV